MTSSRSTQWAVVVAQVVLAAAGIALCAAAALQDWDVAAQVPATWLAASVIAATVPLVGLRASKAFWPAAAMAVGIFVTSSAIGVVTSDVALAPLLETDWFLVALSVSSGALGALAFGFAIRALVRESAEPQSNHPLVRPGAGFYVVAAGVALLAFRRLAAGASGPWTVDLPLRAADGPAQWLTEVGRGVTATATHADVAPWLLGSAAALVVAAVVPHRKIAAALGALGAIGLGITFGILIAAHGHEVATLDQTAATTMLRQLGVDPQLARSPRITSPGPYFVDATQMVLPLTMIGAAAASALAQAAYTFFGQTDDDVVGSLRNQIANRLAARDAVLVSVVCVWLAAVLMLFITQEVAGTWGPIREADHLVLGAAFSATALCFALYALQRHPTPLGAALRQLVCALLAIAVVAGLVGGLAGPLSPFEL